ncbi:phage shock protein operon transcriptional activator [Sphingobium nicotianae]|uniref:Phage shock protein operon transcriptional activator n=1 Tax=Sphingobium nicotianae TaxID=2782607 RepID=A0A9X1DF22_9SPHN|nr:phage shock protein operon transcriptional activator [Sphingobium nicotianae]MBT2188861.1 phage shock protein operon transcriptional activator [Sphingobium nicotianae]
MEKVTHFVGQSLAFLDAVEQAGRAAELIRPVLVIGERGTGKELIAERVHRLSPRWDGPLIIMNCAALPETLIEAELFGHEAGAFTGATRARAGRFEEADGGTLFLDELGTLSMAAQERLLRAVEYGEVTRIGSSRPLNVDVRIVAATNEHLPDAVEAGRFRPDLLDRLSFEVITLPPLRGREGDVEVLVEHFGRRMATECRWPGWPGFSAKAMAELTAYSWPGNVRELRNVVERAVYRWDLVNDPIDAIQLDPFASPWQPRGIAARPPRPAEPASAEPVLNGHAPEPTLSLDEISDFRAAVDAHEAAILKRTLERHRFNQRATAKALNLSYDQLRHCLRKHDLL